LLIAPFSYSVNAEAKLEINTYYPNDVMEYANLTNVSNVTTNDNYIAYTTNNVINIFNKKDRSINQIENIDNILKIKFCYEKLLVAGNNTINIIDPITLNVTPISNITYPSNSPINFYFNDTTGQIGIIDTTLQIHSFDISNKDHIDTAIKVNRIVSVLMPAITILMNFTTIAVVWFGAKRIDAGAMQIGDMMAFIQYAMHVLFSFVMATVMFVMLPRAIASGDRIGEVLDVEPSIESKDGSQINECHDGIVEFKNVNFKYPDSEGEFALHNISFKTHPGKVTAIIGSTGSSKTTILNLISRYYDVTDGEILVDGVNVKEYNLDDLRDRIGYVPQKAFLFSGTIKDNILYGKENATDEEIMHAIEVAQATEFVNSLEDGVMAHVAQGGNNFSGGQKQRLSIARAIVRKPEIYIFDDSFSALDFKTDSNLRKALKQETGNSTFIIVAQRVSTIMDADQIIVLNDGKIEGIGNHKELLEKCEVYKEIVYSQLSKEEVEK